MANLINGTVYDIDGAPTTYHITTFGVGQITTIDAYVGQQQNCYGRIVMNSGRSYGVVETVAQLKTAAG